MITSPEDLRYLRPDYTKDPDFEGYLYLYDADIIEEEIQLEELLMKRELNEAQAEVAEKKRQSAKEFLKYAEEKFKTEKKEKGVMGMFSEKKKIIAGALGNMVKMVVPTGEDMEADKKDIFLADTKPGSKLVRGDSKLFEPQIHLESHRRKHEKVRQSIMASPQGTPNKKFVYAKEDQMFGVDVRYIRDRRLSVRFDDDLESVEARVNFFRREIFDTKFKNLSIRTKKLLKTYYDELISKRSKFREKRLKKADFGKNIKREKLKVKGFGPWDVLWEYKYDAIKKESPYNEFPSYMLRQVIVKGGDDLRQEIVAMQLIKKLQLIFHKEGASLVLNCYEIVVINSSSGVIGSNIVK